MLFFITLLCVESHCECLCEGISSSMNFDEEDDDDDEISSSSSQLNSITRPGSATSKKSTKVSDFLPNHTFKHRLKRSNQTQEILLFFPKSVLVC